MENLRIYFIRNKVNHSIRYLLSEVTRRLDRAPVSKVIPTFYKLSKVLTIHLHTVDTKAKKSIGDVNPLT